MNAKPRRQSMKPNGTKKSKVSISTFIANSRTKVQSVGMLNTTARKMLMPGAANHHDHDCHQCEQRDDSRRRCHRLQPNDDGKIHCIFYVQMKLYSLLSIHRLILFSKCSHNVLSVLAGASFPTIMSATHNSVRTINKQHCIEFHFQSSIVAGV